MKKKPYKQSRQGGNNGAKPQSGKAAHHRGAKSEVKKPSHQGANQPTPKHRANIYGAHAVNEAWVNPARHIRSLIITQSALDGFGDVLAKADRAGLKRPAPSVVDKSVLDKILPQGAVHQGLAIDVAPLADVFIQDFIIGAQARERSVILMLDQVTDPHNVGAIIRSASAFGALGIVMQKKHAPALDGVLAKTACGGVEHMDVAFETNLSRALEELKDNGFFIYGLDERGERYVGEIPKSSDKVVLVLGAEGPGIRRLVKDHCDELVKLPTQPPIGSLNVSNAAAVALYALSV